MVSETTENTVTAGSGVSLNFSLALPGGEVIDSNFGAPPVSFRIGDGSMLPGFEACLMGLAPGDEIERTLPAAEAFGEANPKNRQVFSGKRFASLKDDELIPFEVGSVVSFKDPGGFDLPGVIVAITQSDVTVDFNHPLAGKDIVFRARIDAVLASDVKAVEIKL